MPDIQSFVASEKNQSDIKDSGRTTTKKKQGRGRKASSDFVEEVMPTTGSSTRARKPPAGLTGNSSATKQIIPAAGPTHDDEGVFIVPEGKELKIVYPHKKY